MRSKEKCVTEFPPDTFFPSAYMKAPHALGGRHLCPGSIEDMKLRDSQVCPCDLAAGEPARIPSRPCREGSHSPRCRVYLGL